MSLYSLCREGAQERAHKPEELELDRQGLPGSQATVLESRSACETRAPFACLVTVGALSSARFTQAMLLARSLALAAVFKAMTLAPLRSLVPEKWGRRP